MKNTIDVRLFLLYVIATLLVSSYWAKANKAEVVELNSRIASYETQLAFRPYIDKPCN